jgi:hypothetical protein
VLISFRHPELFRYFLYDELVARVATKHHGRYHGPWFFIPVLLLGFIPWTFFQPSLVRWLNQLRQSPGGLPAVWWFLIGWVIHSLHNPVVHAVQNSLLMRCRCFPHSLLGLVVGGVEVKKRQSIQLPAILATLFLACPCIRNFWSITAITPLSCQCLRRFQCCFYSGSPSRDAFGNCEPSSFNLRCRHQFIASAPSLNPARGGEPTFDVEQLSWLRRLQCDFCSRNPLASRSWTPRCLPTG